MCMHFVVFRTVCYFPDYNLISDADTAQQLNASGYAGGTYIVTSHPSRCAGLGIEVEACFELRNYSTTPADSYRLNVSQYRNTGPSQYTKISSTAAITSREQDLRFECGMRSSKWIVDEGDMIAVGFENDCTIGRSTVCPAQAIFHSPQLTANDTRTSTILSDDGSQHNLAFVNARARVGEQSTTQL